MISDRHKYVRFNLTIGGLIGTFSVSLLTLMLYMDPLIGNLTRMGGFLENDFGWNDPQQVFPQPLFEKAASIEEYVHYFDVVVAGDSFSQNTLSGWQNYFVDATGLSVITFHMVQTPVDEILSSAAFLTHPPRLFVYESIERNLLSRHRSCDGPMPEEITRLRPASISLHSQSAKREWIARSQWAPYAGSTRFDSAINFLRKSGMRSVLGVNLTEVEQFNLDREDLFSSRRSDELLIITRDYRLRGASDTQIATVSCSLLRMQQRVQSNERTRFVALIFPDKTTSYSDHIVDDEYEPMTILSRIEDTEELRSTKLGREFPEAIRDGTVDLYLPNDEHCGYLGYQIAANAVVAALRRSHLVEDP